MQTSYPLGGDETAVTFQVWLSWVRLGSRSLALSNLEAVSVTASPGASAGGGDAVDVAVFIASASGDASLPGSKCITSRFLPRPQNSLRVERRGLHSCWGCETSWDELWPSISHPRHGLGRAGKALWSDILSQNYGTPRSN